MKLVGSCVIDEDDSRPRGENDKELARPAIKRECLAVNLGNRLTIAGILIAVICQDVDDHDLPGGHLCSIALRVRRIVCVRHRDVEALGSDQAEAIYGRDHDRDHGAGFEVDALACTQLELPGGDLESRVIHGYRDVVAIGIGYRNSADRGLDGILRHSERGVVVHLDVGCRAAADDAKLEPFDVDQPVRSVPVGNGVGNDQNARL